MLLLSDVSIPQLRDLLVQRGLRLQLVPGGDDIPGSFWGPPEAGLIAGTVYARADTPVHSLLHEAAHLLVMPEDRRANVHTDASDSLAEEDAACYLQILLADQIDGAGSDRLMADMDAWGYTFRLGSARAWFEHDATEAQQFLDERGIA